MKEDILEQLVEDYFQHKGYFTRHNVKFRPDSDGDDHDSRKDSSYSDIDVLGYKPHPKKDEAQVVAVSCKSWQSGFHAENFIQKIKDGQKINGRLAWKFFRELSSEKWAKAFEKKVKELTGTTEFIHLTAVTVLKPTSGNEKAIRNFWQSECQRFTKTMRNKPIRILTLREILDELWGKKKKTMAESEVGRLIQVMKASGWTPNGKNNP